MQVIRADNINDAILKGIDLLCEHGYERSSRNGPVLVLGEPVTTEYLHPYKNVLFWPERDANPFFHLYEALWMLAGKNDVASLTWFVKNMVNFSDDGQIFHGAYGHRWRNHFVHDQLPIIIERLKQDPDDRRCVLQMWDTIADLMGPMGNDVPCNTQAYFSLDSSGFLDMTVCNRSNDIIWGTYGANAVHFSILQKYIAEQIGCPIGRYWQISNNFHAYQNILQPLTEKHRSYVGYSDKMKPEPLKQATEGWADWQTDLKQMFSCPPNKAFQLRYRTIFFEKTLRRMIEAYAYHKAKDTQRALHVAVSIHAPDWQRACTQWFVRRLPNA